MISTDDRSPSGRDSSSTTRLSHDHLNNNNNSADNLYYQYVPEPHNGSTLTASQSTPIISVQSTPSSPILSHRHSIPQQQIILRDPTSFGFTNEHSLSTSALAITSGSPAVSPSNGISDFIHHTLSSRLIPKLGSIVKRFSLNYSGEGLVTDRQRTRTVRVGIRFQVQVDSFVNNRSQERPRAILRTQSAPAVEQLDSGFSSPTTDIFPPNRQLALEYPSNASSTLSVADSSSGSGVSGGGIQIGIGSCADSCSSGVSSESTSPVLSRRGTNHTSLPITHEQTTSNTLAFHNRINQALNSYRSQQDSEPRARRSSVHVYRRRSISPERPTETQTSHNIQPNSSNAQAQNMEDSSSFQVLRHFPGSNVNSLNELSWETAAFEKEIRDRIQWLSDKVSSIRMPRIISQLVDVGREYARENPMTALILLALCLTSSAPVLIFLVFAVATILVTFLGFLFVEGTLLTGATVIFGGVILLVGFLTLSGVLLGMVGYSATTEAYMVVTGRSRIFKILRKIPVIGRLFPGQSESSNLTNKEDEYSNLANGSLANGKVVNGHGPYHRHLATPYYVDEEDDDIHEILDSDEEVEIHEEIVNRAEEKDEDELVVKNEDAILSTATTTGDLSTSSDLGDDMEEDLGNQEVVFVETIDDHHNEVPEVNHHEGKPSTEPIPVTPVVNGNGYEHTKCGEEHAEESEA